jgi:DNA-binding MarR family transcriptional regulator
MDKSSVSRCFKSMQANGYITLGLDVYDGRVRLATITKTGRQVHDGILGIALERERALLDVLSEAERRTLTSLLKSLHENLPAVEAATEAYVTRQFPRARRRSRKEDEHNE